MIVQNYVNLIYSKSKFNDDFFTTDKQDETINYNHQEIIYDNPKSFKAKVPKQKTIVSEKINLIFGQDINIDRQIYYNESQNLKGMEYNNIGLSSQHTNIYTPDSVSNANKRYTLTKNLFKEIFFNITSMECIGSNIDWLQFGIFELDGDTIFKSNGKLFFVAEEEIGLITKKDMHLETLNDSKLFMNSRQCSLIKDDQESIRYRTKMSLEQNKQMIFAQEQENFITSLKDRVSIVEDKLKQIEKLEK